MTWRSPEIEVIEHWRDVWWNLETDTEFTQAVTGTPWMPLSAYPKLERRRIEDIYGKAVHKGCGGEFEVTGEEIPCEKNQFVIRCLKCGKYICANM